MSGGRIRRTLLLCGIVVVFLVLAGATYQGVATALERRQFPLPGRLVNLGDHQLHLYCTGQGSPTVVLEAPAAGMSAAWGWVQPDVAQITRTCSYDRAGLGWSEAGDRLYDPATAVEELRTLLQESGEHAPYVLVGQGLGAALLTVYASQYPDSVAALVLVDSPAPGIGDPDAGSTARLLRMSPWLARMGLLRATRTLSNRADGLPEPWSGAFGAFLNRPDHLTRTARELARWDDVTARAADAAIEGVPIVRVDAAGRERLAFLTNRDEAAVASAAIVGVIGKIRGEQ